MRTFAAAKAVIALAVSYQYAEKERFSFPKAGSGLILFFMCIWVRSGACAASKKDIIIHIIIKI